VRHRPLILGPGELAAMHAIAFYAAKPENRYNPLVPERSTPPGMKPAHCLTLGLPGRTYRCVFSFTEMPDGRLIRHLSISVPEMVDDPKLMPGIFACWTLAHAFGFSGWDGRSEKPPETWQIAPIPRECVVIAERVE